MTPARPRLRLIHWNACEARTRAASLRDDGYQVSWGTPADLAELRVLRTRVPAAVVVDLTRLPAQGRDVGILLRTWKSTRQVPLLFVGGTPEKVERTRQQLPDAIYTPWSSRIRGALRGRWGRLAADFTEKDVRWVGLAHGLVDFKVCAVDADWSGPKFVWRKRARSPVT